MHYDVEDGDEVSGSGWAWGREDEAREIANVDSTYGPSTHRTSTYGAGNVRPDKTHKTDKTDKRQQAVEDVILKHEAIRRYRQEASLTPPVDVGVAGDLRQSVKSIPPMYTTPTKKKRDARKKGPPSASASPRRSMALRNKNADRKGGGEGKGKSKSRERKGFAFFGNLFGSVEGASSEQGTGAGQGRPPRLVVDGDGRPGGRDDGNDGNDGRVDEHDEGSNIVSPLMLVSPGPSCGGLLDEKFFEAMRGAEGKEDGGKEEGMGASDDALLQALSPRSLLASPRVIRKLSGATGARTQNPQKNAQKPEAREAPEQRWEQQAESAGGEGSVAPTTTTGNKGKGNDPRADRPIDRRYEDEDQVYSLMQQVKAQQAKILELEAQNQRREERRETPKGAQQPSEQRGQPEQSRRESEQPTAVVTQQPTPTPVQSVQQQDVQPPQQNLDVLIHQIKADAADKLGALKTSHEEERSALLKKCDELEKLVEATNHASKLDAIKLSHEEERLALVKKCDELEKLVETTKLDASAEIESLRQKVAGLEEASGSAERQTALIQDTSMALANQIAVLTQRAQSAEKRAETALQELQIQQAAMKTRVSTLESLNQEIQRLTLENTRLVGDKSSMEEHVRRLTSILHTVMTVGGSCPGAGVDMTTGPGVLPGMSTMGGPISGDVAGRDVDGDVGATGMSGMSGTARVEDAEANERSTTTDHHQEQQRKPLAPRNAEPSHVQPGASSQKANIDKMSPQETRVFKEARTAELDRELMELNMEKEQLDQELARMPANSGGKTVVQRRRKRQVESRLDELFREIGRAKRELRNIKRDVLV